MSSETEELTAADVVPEPQKAPFQLEKIPAQ